MRILPITETLLAKLQAPIAALRAGRHAALLAKPIRWNGSVMSKAQMIEALAREGYTLHATIRPRYHFDRTAFNRMDYREQTAYEARLKETVLQWIACAPGESGKFYELTQTEAAHFHSVGGALGKEGIEV